MFHIHNINIRRTFWTINRIWKTLQKMSELYAFRKLITKNLHTSCPSRTVMLTRTWMLFTQVIKKNYLSVHNENWEALSMFMDVIKYTSNPETGYFVSVCVNSGRRRWIAMSLWFCSLSRDRQTFFNLLSGSFISKSHSGMLGKCNSRFGSRLETVDVSCEPRSASY